MIDRQEYLRAKQIVEKYESEQLRLSRFKGESKCPFCGGTKIKPFVRPFRNQNCNDCDLNGMISNMNLVSMGLEDFIEKIELTK
jgi:hypothetical protein